MPCRFFLLLLLAMGLGVAKPSVAQPGAVDLSVVEKWLSTNTGIGSVRIDFTQTRKMKALNVPITQDGTLWLDYAGHQFRWQTGDPPNTIVVSLGENVLIIRTPGKKYEVRKAGTGDTPAMAAMAKGFPRTLADFQARYQVTGIRPEANTQRIVTRPLGETGRGVRTFTFIVEASHFRLLGLEIDLEDGSSVQTVFRKVEPNVPVPPELFRPPVDGYTETKF